ncbi:hypothetical protein [Deinococcus marmoris]|uniref:Uncharacterized protein n=1 Tax=Deinococcus marmoris TaxID=249408 RepID=A0A1U7P4R3_9DEIO|nr:hypothetical protein [Deinococcus marmoris]OLV20148.1 hypothetical protein BOO71_0000472 [Deinococcus marmoris]
MTPADTLAQTWEDRAAFLRQLHRDEFGWKTTEPRGEAETLLTCARELRALAADADAETVTLPPLPSLRVQAAHVVLLPLLDAEWRSTTELWQAVQGQVTWGIFQAALRRAVDDGWAERTPKQKRKMAYWRLAQTPEVHP